MAIDADGAVISASERHAAFTDTQRRLIAVRDKHCVFPACDAPAPWCEVHHLHWRSHGGGRTLDNGVLLCRRHHTLLHHPSPRTRWRLHRNPHGHGWHATSPTGTTWTGHPHPGPHHTTATHHDDTEPRPDHRPPPAATATPDTATPLATADTS